MSGGRVVNGDKILDALAQNKILTPEGAEWLKCAVDPFHDTEVNVKGFPDINVAPSVVQLVKQTASISCPTSITTGTWDANIFTLPWFTAESMDTWTKTDQVVYSPTASGVTLGAVNCIAVQSGNSTALGASGTVATNPIAYANSYFDGPARVIAAGLEIVNTTSDLNKQGLVIVYRMPLTTPLDQEGWCIASAGPSTPVVGSFTGPSIGFWPSTAANAMLLTGSRQWAAEEGAYEVLTLNSMFLPVTGEDYVIPVLMIDEVVGGLATTCATPTPQAIGGATLLTFTPLALQPMNMSGAYFTGLSLQTTLQVTMNLYIERFPDPTEADLAPLAKPSPGFDPEAIKFYSMVLSDLPPGVMVKENGLGDWFMDAVGSIASVAAPVLKSIPLPITQGLGIAADAFSRNRADSSMRVPRATERSKEFSAVAPPSSYIEPEESSCDCSQSYNDGYDRGVTFARESLRRTQSMSSNGASRKKKKQPKKKGGRRRR